MGEKTNKRGATILLLVVPTVEALEADDERIPALPLRDVNGEQDEYRLAMPCLAMATAISKSLPEL